jgi:hypothetical protein
LHVRDELGTPECRQRAEATMMGGVGLLLRMSEAPSFPSRVDFWGADVARLLRLRVRDAALGSRRSAGVLRGYARNMLDRVVCIGRWLLVLLIGTHPEVRLIARHQVGHVARVSSLLEAIGPLLQPFAEYARVLGIAAQLVGDVAQYLLGLVGVPLLNSLQDMEQAPRRRKPRRRRRFSRCAFGRWCAAVGHRRYIGGRRWALHYICVFRCLRGWARVVGWRQLFRCDRSAASSGEGVAPLRKVSDIHQIPLFLEVLVSVSD